VRKRLSERVCMRKNVTERQTDTHIYVHAHTDKERVRLNERMTNECKMHDCMCKHEECRQKQQI
jgi:hypothetical protein